MAFFNDIGRRAKQMVQNYSEISKLNTAVNENRQTMDEAYRQLGKQYMAMHPEDYANEFAGIVATIAATENKAKDLHLRLMRVKGIVACPKCGNEAPYGSSFCSVCGTELPSPNKSSAETTEEVIAVRQCSACGAELPQDAAFCSKCGASLQ